MVDNAGNILGKDKRRLSDTIEQQGTIDAASYFENPRNIVRVREINLKADQQTPNGSVLVLGHSTWGHIGSFVLGDGDSRETTRWFESYHFMDLDIDFSSTDYEHANSTATGWGTGSLTFLNVSGSSEVDFTTGTSTATISTSTGSIELN